MSQTNSLQIKLRPTQPSLLIIATASWLGLLVGYIEVLLRLVIKYFLNQLLFLSPHFVWMAPFAYLILLSLIGIFFAVLAYFWPKLPWIPVVVFVCTILGLIGIYYVKPRIHIAAFILLAVGISVQLSLVVKRHLENFQKIVLRSLPWMVAALSIIAVLSIMKF